MAENQNAARIVAEKNTTIKVEAGEIIYRFAPIALPPAIEAPSFRKFAIEAPEDEPNESIEARYNAAVAAFKAATTPEGQVERAILPLSAEIAQLQVAISALQAQRTQALGDAFVYAFVDGSFKVLPKAEYDARIEVQRKEYDAAQRLLLEQAVEAEIARRGLVVKGKARNSTPKEGNKEGTPATGRTRSPDKFSADNHEVTAAQIADFVMSDEGCDQEQILWAMKYAGYTRIYSMASDGKVVPVMLKDGKWVSVTWSSIVDGKLVQTSEQGQVALSLDSIGIACKAGVEAGGMGCANGSSVGQLGGCVLVSDGELSKWLKESGWNNAVSGPGKNLFGYGFTLSRNDLIAATAKWQEA